MFSNDLDLVMRPLSSTYSASLNSGDKYDPELPLMKSKAHGGTLVLWKKVHDPHITVWPVSSQSFLPVLFHPPGSMLSIHVAIYLPTAGQDAPFLNELSNLSATLDAILENHPESPVYSNTKRVSLLDIFCNQMGLLEVPLLHPTYHHFMKESASYLDRLLFSSSLSHHEILRTIHCKLVEPLINYRYDMLVSSWSVTNMKNMTILFLQEL